MESADRLFTVPQGQVRCNTGRRCFTPSSDISDFRVADARKQEVPNRLAMKPPLRKQWHPLCYLLQRAQRKNYQKCPQFAINKLIFHPIILYNIAEERHVFPLGATYRSHLVPGNHNSSV